MIRIIHRVVIFVLMFCCFFPTIRVAQTREPFLIGEINPDNTRLGVFNSYKHQVVIVAFTQPTTPSFDCLPNRYVIFNYGELTYKEVRAGNLKINSDFSSILSFKIHSLSDSSSPHIDTRKKAVLSMLNVSEATLKAGITKSLRRALSCWQQPELLDKRGNSIRTYPLLAANLCQTSWCSEMFWTGPDTIKFWVQQTPDTLKLVSLNTGNGQTTTNTQRSIFKVTRSIQSNAPRENLVTSKNLEGQTLKLTSQITLIWKTLPGGNIEIALTRPEKQRFSTQSAETFINNALESNRKPEALKLIEFALWLDPGNIDIRFSRLKIYASLMMTDDLFALLENNFTAQEKVSVCSKIHLDPAFREQLTDDAFTTQFKTICAP